MSLEGLKVPGHTLPCLHFDAPEPAQEGQGLGFALERGEGGDQDGAALDGARCGLAQEGGEAAGAVGDEGDFVGHAAQRSAGPWGARGCAVTVS